MSTPKNGFQIHDKDDAPEGCGPILEKVQQGFGFVPNVIGVMAASPAATEAYTTLSQIVQTKTAFTPTEQQVLLLTVSEHNGCDYCVAAHTGSAKRVSVDESVIEALRAGKALPDAKLEALATLARKLIDKKGWLDDADVKAFLDAGYSHQQYLDALVVLAMKTISNYTNHAAETPLDPQLQPMALKKAS